MTMRKLGHISALAMLGWLALTNAQVTLAQSLTREQVASRIEAGELDPSPLFLPDAERRIVFGETAYFAPTRPLLAGDAVYPLVAKPVELGDVKYTVGGESFHLRDFLQREPLMGLIVIKDDNILLEHYAGDHGPERLWISFSVTKSVNSMLIGAAIEDGYIRSVDDRVGDYLPRLRDSEYADVTIENILHMASGVEWDEDYTDPESDVSKAGALNGVALTDHLAGLGRAHPPGEVFNYNTGEANLVGEVLRAAIGNNASTYLTHKIWQPFGMEFDATWLIDRPGGVETGGCCISATLRDYARLGIFAMHDGVLPSGERVLPEGWMAASTQPSEGYEGYGYQWWLNGDGSFNASGIFGQKIYVNPDKKLVIAAHSNAPTATGSDYAAHLASVLEAIDQQF